MDRESRVRIRAHGADPDHFAARQITRDMVMDADLVIAAARDHLAAVAEQHPRALRYAFALHDLADLLGVVSESDIAAAAGENRVAKVAAAAIAARGIVSPRLPEESGIVDPFRREAAVFDQMVNEIGRSLPTLLAAVRGCEP